MPQTISSPALPIHIERTDLPRLYLQKAGAVRYHAYIQSYISGKPTRVNGRSVTPLYFLSLVAQRGHGAVLRGLWSALVANHLEELFLDGLDRVALAHHCLPNLRVKLHWNYHQAQLANGDLHVIIESHQLTMWDPVRADAAPPRGRQAGKGKTHSSMELSTLTRKEEGDESEQVRRRRSPLFLLLVPSSVLHQGVPDEREQMLAAFRARQHFAFLEPRYPWPLLPEWAEFLWERGVSTGEISKLTCWSSTCASQNALDAPPFFAEAWLCRPNVEQIQRDLVTAHTQGRLPLPDQLARGSLAVSATPARELVGGHV